MRKFIFLLIILIACGDGHHEKSKEEEGVRIDNYEIKSGDKLDSAFWKFNEPVAKDVSISIPLNWKVVDQHSYPIFCYIDSVDKDEFFVLGIYNMDSLNIDEKSFISETYRQLYADTIELLVSYDIKMLFFKTGHAYYSTYTVKNYNKNYDIYSMTFSYESKLYDITLKSDNSKTKKYSEIYRDILYSIRIDKRNYFENKGEILKYKEISLSEL